VVREPLGGAHRDFKTMGENLKETLIRHLDSIQQQDMQTILATRYQRIMSFGVFEESSK
jgi:acetyl-CoA carboxylase carboxyl transferase subunit alpha